MSGCVCGVFSLCQTALAPGFDMPEPEFTFVGHRASETDGRLEYPGGAVIGGRWVLPDAYELRGLSPNGVEIYLDREAQVTPAALSPSLGALQELAYDKSGAEFLYVFADGQWHTLRPGQSHGL